MPGRQTRTATRPRPTTNAGRIICKRPGGFVGSSGMIAAPQMAPLASVARPLRLGSNRG
jgi:hypothetical protein